MSLEFLIDINNPSGRTMAPGLTQSLTENEYREYFLGGKGCRCVELSTLPFSCADCLEIWEPQPPGTLRACADLSRDCFTFLIIVKYIPLMYEEEEHWDVMGR
jgi:hypothetical protein